MLASSSIDVESEESDSQESPATHNTWTLSAGTAADADQYPALAAFVILVDNPQTLKRLCTEIAALLSESEVAFHNCI